MLPTAFVIDLYNHDGTVVGPVIKHERGRVAMSEVLKEARVPKGEEISTTKVVHHAAYQT